MALFPLFADLKGKSVLVVGGGAVAERKVASLLNAEASVKVGAPAFTDALHRLAAQKQIELIKGEFQPEWLHQAWLIIAATDNRMVNRRIATLATAAHRFINVVDDPELSSFQMPSIVDRSPLLIAISSSGSAPVLARRVRERLETLFDHSLGGLVALAQKHRIAIRRLRPNLNQRRQFYDWLLDGPVAGALRAQHTQLAEHLLEEELAHTPRLREGRVVLVGAGPGDPGLLTLKALRALNEADIILYDRLVSPEIRALARRDATQISVGKTPGEDHEATQKRIHALMLHYAQAGEQVVRLKGGDAFIFGRGGEELQFLQAHGVRYEVVPGITAAIACAAYAGIPLTHREFAQSVHFITAHSAKACDTHDWAGLAKENQTLAFYMGASQMTWLAGQLTHHGLSLDTPFAVIENGTRANQRVLSGTLRNLDSVVTDHAIQAPSMLLIGKVAALGHTLHWFGAHVPTQEAVAL